jgi:hypothetical protein
VTYTYTITLEQMSEDTSEGLDASMIYRPDFSSGYPIAEVMKLVWMEVIPGCLFRSLLE